MISARIDVFFEFGEMPAGQGKMITLNPEFVVLESNFVPAQKCADERMRFDTVFCFSDSVSFDSA